MSTQHRLTEIFRLRDAGAKAYADGKGRGSNPYRSGYPDALQWDHGWCNAQAVDMATAERAELEKEADLRERAQKAQTVEELRSVVVDLIGRL